PLRQVVEHVGLTVDLAFDPVDRVTQRRTTVRPHLGVDVADLRSQVELGGADTDVERLECIPGGEHQDDDDAADQRSCSTARDDALRDRVHGHPRVSLWPGGNWACRLSRFTVASTNGTVSSMPILRRWATSLMGTSTNWSSAPLNLTTASMSSSCGLSSSWTRRRMVGSWAYR